MERTGLQFRMLIAGSIIFAVYLFLASLALGAGVGLPTVLLASFIFVGIQYKLGKWLALRSVGAEDAHPQEYPDIHRTVEDLSTSMEIPKPRVMVAPMGVPNAFAVGRQQAGTVVLGQELIQILDDDELKAVIAHELSHIRNRDVVVMVIGQSIAAMIGIVVHWVTIVASRRSFLGYVAGIILGTIAQMAVMVFVLAVSRYREYIADDDAAAVTGQPRTLASALAKIAVIGRDPNVPNVNDSVDALCIFGGQRGFLATVFATHPPVEKRMNRLAPGYDPDPETVAAELEAQLFETCPECGEAVTSDWAYCESCGSALDAEPETSTQHPVACPGCGGDVDLSWQFCESCGHELAS